MSSSNMDEDGLILEVDSSLRLSHDTTRVDTVRPYFPELCLETTRRPPSAAPKSAEFAEDPPRHSCPTQDLHIAAWRSTNKNCKHTRQKLRERFFSERGVAMRWAFAHRLRDHRASNVWTAEDQECALNHIRSVIIVDTNPWTASNYIKLPQLLASFKQLKVCTIMYLSSGDLEENTEPYAIPDEMKELLHSIGVSKDIELRLEARPNAWAGCRFALRNNVYPMLRIRAEMLAKTRGTTEMQTE